MKVVALATCLAAVIALETAGVELTVPETGLAAVREAVHLELTAGLNQVEHVVTSLAEPDTVL